MELDKVYCIPATQREARLKERLGRCHTGSNICGRGKPVSCMFHVSFILRVSCLPVSFFMLHAFYEYLVSLSYVSCFMHSTSILSACLPATQLLQWSFSLISFYCSPMVILSPPVVTLLILAVWLFVSRPLLQYYGVSICTSISRLLFRSPHRKKMVSDIPVPSRDVTYQAPAHGEFGK
jgi:hypothetical protein